MSTENFTNLSSLLHGQNCTNSFGLSNHTNYSFPTGLLYDQTLDDMKPIDPRNYCFGDFQKIWIRKPMYEVIYKSVIVAIIMLIGLVGNFMVIFLVLKRPQIRQIPINLFIVNLAIADFLTLLFTPSVALVDSIFQNYELGPVMCKMEILIKMMCILASNFSVVAISMNRFIYINKNSHQVKSCSCTLIIIILIWICSIGLSLPLSFYRHYHERQWKDHLEKWCCDDPPIQSKKYWIFLMSPLLYLPLVLMIIAYSLMIFKINRFIEKLQAQYPSETSKRTNRAMSLSGASTLSISPNWSALPEDKRQVSPEGTVNHEPSFGTYAEPNSDGSKSTASAEEHKVRAYQHKKSIMVTICVYCITTFFLWLPLQVLVYYRAFKKSEPMSDWFDIIKFIAQILCAVNAALNPFITFRKTFALKFKKFCARRKPNCTHAINRNPIERVDYNSDPNLEPEIGSEKLDTLSSEKRTNDRLLFDNSLPRVSKKHNESWVLHNNRHHMSIEQAEHPPSSPLVLTREVLRKGEQVAANPVPVEPPIIIPTEPISNGSTQLNEKTLIPATSLTKRVLLKYVPEIFENQE